MVWKAVEHASTACLSKSNMLVPAKGVFDKVENIFKGRCIVCHFDFVDYLIHISSDYHKNNIRQNNFEKDIANLCDQVINKVQTIQRPRRKGRFCHSNGTTKKHKFFKKS
jgi:hypothetical protein